MKQSAKKLISIIIPAYNEEECVDELCRRLQKLFTFESQYDFEILIIENGSSDNTWNKLKTVSASDNHFKIIRLSRNFRMDGGLTAGLEFARGDAVVTMTADLQDPPELISDFIRAWEAGYQNIYGVVTKRTGTGPIRTLNSKIFYLIASSLTDGRIPKNASDFRLVDRQVYESVREMRERNRFVRGLFAWSGYRSIGIPMVRDERYGGVSNAHTLAVIDLAFKGIFAHSYKPLKIITLFGALLSFISISSIVPLSYIWLTKGVPFAGFGTLLSLFLLMISFLFLFLGIIGEYIGLIYEEVKQRPNFLISETINV
jgi:polyisoprenyl-phosphate glycosyltransferase